jgi:exonuclease III
MALSIIGCNVPAKGFERRSFWTDVVRPFSASQDPAQKTLYVGDFNFTHDFLDRTTQKVSLEDWSLFQQAVSPLSLNDCFRHLHPNDTRLSQPNANTNISLYSILSHLKKRLFYSLE